MEECRHNDNSLEIKIVRLEERLIASDRALELARDGMEIWKAHTNEVREQILDERKLFSSTGRVDSLTSRIENLEKINERISGIGTKIDRTWAYVVIIIGFMFSVIEFLIRWKI